MALSTEDFSAMTIVRIPARLPATITGSPLSGKKPVVGEVFFDLLVEHAFS